MYFPDLGYEVIRPDEPYDGTVERLGACHLERVQLKDGTVVLSTDLWKVYPDWKRRLKELRERNPYGAYILTE